MILIILTVADGKLQLCIYDPSMQNLEAWGDKFEDPVAFTDACNDMLERDPESVEKVQIQPWEFLILANPAPHAVTKILEGDRFAFVIFFGHRN